MTSEVKQERVSVQVNGVMTPTLHHPAWYLAKQIITDAEYTSSIGQPLSGVAVTPPVAGTAQSRFQFVNENTFTMTCTPNSWIVEANGQMGRNRLLNLTAQVFKFLYETQFSMFSIGYDGHLSLPGVEFPSAFMKAIVKNSLWAEERLNQFKIQSAETTEWGSIQQVIEQSNLFPKALFVSIRRTFDIDKMITPGKEFDFSDLISSVFQGANTELDNQVLRIISSIEGWVV